MGTGGNNNTQPAIAQFIAAMQQYQRPTPQQTVAPNQQQQFQQFLQAMQQYAGTVPQGPTPGYQQMMPVNFAIPQYLTVREERHPDESLFKVLGREVARSVGKSIGHTFANFFDTTPIRLKQGDK